MALHSFHLNTIKRRHLQQTTVAGASNCPRPSALAILLSSASSSSTPIVRFAKSTFRSLYWLRHHHCKDESAPLPKFQYSVGAFSKQNRHLLESDHAPYFCLILPSLPIPRRTGRSFSTRLRNCSWWYPKLSDRIETKYRQPFASPLSATIAAVFN